MPRELECVLLHGWGTSNSIWQELAESLSSFSNVSMPSLYEIANKTKDNKFDSMAAVLSENITSETIVIAWSIGGLVAIPLVKLNDKVKAIIFVASTPCFVNKKDWSNVIENKGIEDLQLKLSKNVTSTLKYFAGLIAHGDKSVKKTNKMIRNNLADKKYSAILSSWLTQMQEVDEREALAQLSLPMQVILGENDSLIHLEIKDQLKQLNSNIQQTVIKNCGHAPFVGKPEETIKIMNEFINARFN